MNLTTKIKYSIDDTGLNKNVELQEIMNIRVTIIELL
jgi:hypothetical protein